MTVFIKIIAVMILSVPVFFLNEKIVAFLSGRIERELIAEGESFDPPRSPKRTSVIFGVLTLMLFIAAALLSGESIDARSLIRFASCLFLVYILAIVSRLDIAYFIIPNGITLLLLIFSAIVSVAVPLIFNLEIFDSILNCLIGFLVGGLSLFIINIFSRFVFKRDGIGGGDVKLMFSVGLLLGWKLTVLALLIGFIIGAVCGVILKLVSKPAEPRDITDAGERSGLSEDAGAKDSKVAAESEVDGHFEIPFGPYLAVGSIVAAFAGHSIIAWYLSILGM